MANGEAFDDAVRLARETPTLDIGCHLVLVRRRSLLTGKPLPADAWRNCWRPWRGARSASTTNWRAQVRRILEAGIQPTHLDTHKHTHLAPPVLDAVARMGEEFGIRWVRRPFDFPLTTLRGRGAAGQAPDQPAPGLSCGAGFIACWRGTAAAPPITSRAFRSPAGCARRSWWNCWACSPRQHRIDVHPGRCGEPLRHARTRLKESRERELEALLAPEARQALERHGIELVNYRGWRPD